MSTNSYVIPNDMSDLCRVCLQLPEESQYLDLTTIYDEEDNLTYGECFTICTEIDLSAGEGIPHYLCKSCGLELQMSYDFYKKIEESKRVIEQFQRQIKAQKVNSAVKTKTLKLDGCGKRPRVEVINEKFIIIDDEEHLPVHTEDAEEECVIQPAPSNVNVERDEIDVNMCDTEANAHHQVPSHQNSSTVETINRKDAKVDVEDQLEIEDYQNLETLEEEDPSSVMLKEESINSRSNFTEETITITPCIPTGVRLPIPPGPPFVCEICGHSSNTKNLLASHRHRKHRHKESPYQCDKCDKSFNSKDVYERHIQRLSCQHYPEFSCEYCDKKIIGSANYKIHLRFHKKIYPFECSECGKGFMMAVHLKAHVQTKHENMRYICEVTNCDKNFQSLQSLKSHMYVHLGSLPYSCEYCEKPFPNRGKLRWHIKTVHDFEVCSEDMDRMMVTEEIAIKAKVKPVEFDDC